MKSIISVIINFYFLLFVAINSSGQSVSSNRITILSGKFSFVFNKDSFGYQHKTELIQNCKNAIRSDLKLLKAESYSDSIRFEFMNSRQELKNILGFGPAGAAVVEEKKVYFVTNNMVKNVPIKHEIMHVIACGLWGYPSDGSLWVNEGLATLAENNCSGFNVESIYAYFNEKHMLIPIDSLVSNFYRQPDMIAYHQSAYIVQYLKDHFGIDKLKLLWQRGFDNFEKIYGMSCQTIIEQINRSISKKYPVPPPINWEVLKNGCE